MKANQVALFSDITDLVNRKVRRANFTSLSDIELNLQ